MSYPRELGSQCCPSLMMHWISYGGVRGRKRWRGIPIVLMGGGGKEVAMIEGDVNSQTAGTDRSIDVRRRSYKSSKQKVWIDQLRRAYRMTCPGSRNDSQSLFLRHLLINNHDNIWYLFEIYEMSSLPEASDAKGTCGPSVEQKKREK